MNAATTYERRRLTPVPRARAASFARVADQAMVWRTLVFVLDLASWTACFSGVLYLRMGAAAFHLNLWSSVAVAGFWPLAAIVLTLFIVGGYDRRTDMLSLTYMSEHLIGMGAALIGASVLVYCFAGYEMPVKPGRGTMLLAFVAFTPVSLIYRRAIGVRLQADMARKHFLVIGTAETATAFFAAYRASHSHQALRFIDLAAVAAGESGNEPGRPGGGSRRRIAKSHGTGGGHRRHHAALRHGETLRDALVRTHFQRTPVFTLDTFYETYWRRVPVDALNPSWPLQLGFQLTRSSPYQHFKRLFDVVGALVGLLLLSPLFALIALATWWDSGRPVIFRRSASAVAERDLRFLSSARCAIAGRTMPTTCIPVPTTSGSPASANGCGSCASTSCHSSTTCSAAT